MFTSDRRTYENDHRIIQNSGPALKKHQYRRHKKSSKKLWTRLPALWALMNYSRMNSAGFWSDFSTHKQKLGLQQVCPKRSTVLIPYQGSVADPWHFGVDPDPSNCIIELQDANKKLVLKKSLH